MKMTNFLGILGLIIGFLWVGWGFWKMLAVVIIGAVFMAVGWWLDLQGITGKTLIRQLLTKFDRD